MQREPLCGYKSLVFCPTAVDSDVEVFLFVHHLMALRFPLQFLVVVECQSVQHRMLLFIHCGHGSLSIDLVNIDFSFTLQHGAPPDLTALTERKLKQKQQNINMSSDTRKHSSHKDQGPVPQKPD